MSSSSTPFSERSFLSRISVVFQFIVASFLVLLWSLVVSRMRLLLRWQLRRQIARSECSKDETQRRKAIYARLWLGFLAQAPWTEIEPWLRQTDERTQRQHSQGLTRLYLHNQRPHEAKAAAQLWVTVCQNWINHNNQEATKALKWRRRLRSWYGRDETLPHTVLWGEKAQEAMQKASAFDKSWLREMRDAKLALQFVEWIEKQHPWPLESQDKERNPFIPLPFVCDYEFGQRLGMSDETFDGMCQEATKLSIPH